MADEIGEKPAGSVYAKILVKKELQRAGSDLLRQKLLVRQVRTENLPLDTEMPKPLLTFTTLLLGDGVQVH